MNRKILTVAGKEFRHMAHDRLTLMLTLALPLVQLAIYGYALETRVRHVPAALLVQDTHQAGRLLAERIARSSLFTFDPAYRSETDIQSGLRRGAIRVGIEIPADYSTNLLYLRKTTIRVWVDGSDVATSNYLLAALDSLGMQEALASRIDLDSRVLFNPEGRTAAYLIPGLIAILVQTITALLMALAITTERENGTLEQMLITPLGVDAIIAGKTLAIFCVGLAECAALALLMRYLFVIPIQGSLLLFVSILPLLVFAPIGLGMLIGARARNQTQVLQLANLILLPSIMLSGFVFPREYLNFPMDWASRFVPSTYLVSLTRDIVLHGSPAGELGGEVAVTAGFGCMLSAAGYFALRRSLRL